MIFQWKQRPEHDSELPLSAVPSTVVKLLAARGVFTEDAFERLTKPKLSSLKDPYSIIDMSAAIERLLKAVRGNEKICIYADFDLDGTSGCALLLEGFRQLGLTNVVYAQPKRLSEGYGFHSHIVSDLAKNGVTLIVTVDVGITAFEAVETAKSLGVDVIITDHHQPAATLPQALAVVNPNRAECTSGLGYLSGAGVAFYLLRALARAMAKEGLIQESQLDLKSVLDCFTIATLTDMVPLVEDNRVLVRHGLHQLQNTKRHGLRALLESLSLTDRPLSSQDVAIRFAPKLNALSRMESGLLPIDIYLSESKEKAENLVSEILDNNSTRVQLQSTGEQEAIELLKDWQHSTFVFVISEMFHRGVVGLIATKLSQSMGVPAFVGAISEDGSVTGSARLPNGHSSRSLLSAFESGKTHFMRFGGHDAAAGFEFQQEKYSDIVTALAAHYASLPETGAIVESFYDTDLSADEVNEGLMRWLDELGPFGTGMPVPVFRVSGFSVSDIYELKGGHIKLRLEGEASRKKVDALLFSSPYTKEQLAPLKGREVPFFVELQWNYFAGRRSIQFLVKDFVWPKDVEAMTEKS